MRAVLTNPMQIEGRWKEGWVLDYQIVSSTFIGYNAYGYPRFDTVRTEIGELVYRLKYKGRKDALEELVTVAAGFVKKWAPPVDAVVPTPPSKARATQPVLRVAGGLAVALRLPLHDVVLRTTGSAKQLKDVSDYQERIKLLENAHEVTDSLICGKSVLLVDDLYESGATLNAVTAALYDKGGVSAVYAFAVTRTGSAS